MPNESRLLTAVVRGIARVALALYFRRVQSFHAEAVPASGPLLFVSNHPGSLVDAFLIGTAAPRQVHFVAAVALFRSRPVAWLLRRCGVIPINRRQDDPAKMRTVARTFEACHRVFDAGGAIGIFPEGITYDDERLKTVKTGAARLAIEFAERHDGASGLTIIPVGLTYSAKDRYRSEVLVNFGRPLQADAWVTTGDDHKSRVRALTAEIDTRLRQLILDLPTLEHERLVAAVGRLYLERLRAGNLIVTEPMPRPAETLVLMQAVGAAVTYIQATHPARLKTFVADLDRYEERLHMFGLSEDRLERLEQQGRASHDARTTALFALGAPLAFYGWLHRVVPAAVVEWAARNLTRRTPRAQAALTAILAGAVAFGASYAFFAWVAHLWLGWRGALVYVATLPPAGLFSHSWQLALRAHGLSLRTARLLLRAPLVRKDLVRRRARLIEDIEAFRSDYRRHLVATGAAVE